MLDYNAAKIFIHVVKHGSFSGAAKELSTPVSTVSRKVSELEEQLNVRLMERTTRQLRLTDSGNYFYEYATRSIDELETGLLHILEKQETLKGSLRIELPPSFEPWWPILKQFQNAHPNVKLKIHHSTSHLDFIADGIDIAVRFGEIKNESLIARKVAFSQRRLVATPDFVAKFGQPNTPSELAHFNCLAIGDIHTEVEWQVGEERIKIDPYTISNDFRLIKFMTISGEGIGYLPPGYYLDELENGTLVQILEDFPIPMTDISIVYPSRKQLSRVTRTFIDFCIDNLKDNEKSLWQCIGMP